MGNVDNWYVGSREITGLRFRIDVDQDDEIGDPSKEYDCYDEADVEAWRADQWQWVIVTVTPEYKGHEIVEARDSLGAVEWGELPGAPVEDIGREYFEENHPLPDMIKEVMSKLRAALNIEIGAARQDAEADEFRATQFEELQQVLAQGEEESADG